MRIVPLFLLASLILFWNCDHNNSGTKSKDFKKGQATGPVELVPCPAPDSAALYPDLELGGFLYARQELKFDTRGFVLGTKTPGAEQRPSRRINKGNHMRAVIDDSIDVFDYDNNIKNPLTDGRHQVTAFISRSYHESVKNPKAVIAQKFELKNAQMIRNEKITEAILAYNAPTGDFEGDNAENIVFDFFIANTQISPKGNKVRLSIDQKQEFFVYEWKAYYIHGLSSGEHLIEIELLNSQGQRLYGPLRRRIRVSKKN